MTPNAPQTPEEHVRIHNHCGACGQLFVPREGIIIALYYKQSSIVIRRAGLFSGKAYKYERDWERTSGRTPSFCKIPLCVHCQKAEESVTLHIDCLNLFKQQYADGKAGDGPEQRRAIYERLLLAGTRRYAWHGMPSLEFPNSTTLEMPPPELISKICGFQDSFLPQVPEAARLVQSYSKSHILWRFCSVLQLVRDLKSAEANEAVTYPLPKVLSWFRGNDPELVQDEGLADPFIRVTTDARGIKSIERIPEPPKSTAAEIPTPSCVFLVQSVEDLSAYKIEFELGMSRLHVPAPLWREIKKIRLWSTPTLPHLGDTSHGLLSICQRLSSVSLDPNYCTGISFFMLKHELFDIYGHSTRYPSTHLERFEYMDSINSAFDTEVIWIYVPLTAQDRITAVGIRRPIDANAPSYFTLHTRTEKIVIGTPWREGPPGPMELFELEQDSCRHLNLIYSISLLGMPNVEPDSDKTTESTDADSPPTIQSLPRAYFSSASLEGILNVDVFTNKYKSICRGLLIEYENGSKRALGQCRLGLDTVQSWHKPLSFFYVSESYERNVPSLIRDYEVSTCVRVAFDSESSHVSEDGSLETNYYEMKGRINFWFTRHDTELRIVDF